MTFKFNSETVQIMKHLAFIALIILPLVCIGQTREFGIQLGTTNYLGDLAPTTSIKEFNEHLGVYWKHNRPTGFVSWKYAFAYGKISGNDLNFESNSSRNLNFRSSLYEASIQFEFNFQKFFIGLRAEKFSPYIYTGLGATYFNPQGSMDENWVDLRPLSTEGQGLPNGPKGYSNITLVMPVGVGAKWELGRRWNAYLFTGFRLSFTDYLDDVSGNYYDNASINELKGELAAQMANKNQNKVFQEGKQRGSVQGNDWYYFSGVSIAYWLQDRNCFNFK